MRIAIAIVRSLFLVFITIYTLRAMPFIVNMSRTFDEQYARCSASVGLLERAAWLAVAWIGLETAAGWWVALRERKAKKAAEDAKLTAPAAPTA
jgi:hypothetical protein